MTQLTTTMPGFNLDLVVYDDNLEEIDSLKCCSCNLLLKEPFQLNDGRRICSSCLQRNTNLENSTKLDIEEKVYFFDKFTWNYIKTIEVFCENKNYGCNWKGTISNLEDHLINCEMDQTTGTRGSEIKKLLVSTKEGYPEKSLEENEITIIHPNMNKKGVKKDISQNSFSSVIKCENCNDVFSTDQFENHHKIWCDGKKKVCPFTEEGCQHEEAMNKTELSAHMELSIINHLLFLLTQIRNIRYSFQYFITTNFDGFKNEMFTRINHMGAFASEIESKLMKWADYVKSQFARIWERIEHILKLLAEMESTLQHFISKTEENETQLSEMQNKMFAQQAQIAEQMKDLEIMHKNTEKYRDQLAALRGAYYELMTSQRNKNDEKTPSALPAPVYPPEGSSDYIINYDGVLLWKVSNVMKKREDAILKKVPSIISPPFYSSNHGYKLCARLYINGDGTANGKYLSLFFAIMKGPYDAVLSWPFKRKITMTLLDQENVKNHEDSFFADVTSSSFQRPKNEMNVASGSPRFFPLEALDTCGYIRDDTLFIKITISDQ